MINFRCDKCNKDKEIWEQYCPECYSALEDTIDDLVSQLEDANTEIKRLLKEKS